MKKFQKNIVSALVVLLLFVTMPFVVYASENDYDVYLKVTYADGTISTYDAARNWREANGKIINIYTDNFPITLELYRKGHWSKKYTIYSFGKKTLDYQKEGILASMKYAGEVHGYAKVNIQSLEQHEQEKKAESERETVEKRNENFKKMLKNAGVQFGYDWYIENDLNKFISGEWDGDRKSDSTYGDRIIIGRKYIIYRDRPDYANKYQYECNLDYMGDLEVESFGFTHTLAISKKNNKISCWQYFECLDQWDTPKTETITQVLPNYIENYCYGLCKTKDIKGVEHLYSLNINGKLYKVH